VNRVLFIVGTSYTGSTLLAFLLDAQPEMVSVGELRGPNLGWDDPRTYPCSCGETLESCEFWSKVSDGMAARGHRFDAGHWDLRFLVHQHRLARLLTRSLGGGPLGAARDHLLIRTPRWGAKLRDVASRNEAVVRTITDLTGTEVFVDSSKDPVRARYLDRLSGLDIHVVHLVRDSVGFVSSYLKNKSSLKSDRALVATAIRRWNRMAACVERLLASIPSERQLLVRYEDLCADTEKLLERIAVFVGLRADRAPVDVKADRHHIIGNRMRLSYRGGIAVDESWKARLSTDQIEYIRKRTRRHRRLFGYG
jgi:hypothetical protein